MTTTTRSPLAPVLGIDAVFSGICAIVLVAAAAPITAWSGLPTWLVLALGVGIAGHAALLVLGVRSPDRAEAVTRYAVAANAGWVVAALVVLVAGWLDPGPALALAIISIPVAVFAVVQYRALGDR